MTFADGTVIYKDLIVVADGVHVSRVSLLPRGRFYFLPSTKSVCSRPWHPRLLARKFQLHILRSQLSGSCFPLSS
jgi:hypothetical protein